MPSSRSAVVVDEEDDTEMDLRWAWENPDRFPRSIDSFTNIGDYIDLRSLYVVPRVDQLHRQCRSGSLLPCPMNVASSSLEYLTPCAVES